MYITSSEYSYLTGRAAAEATTVRIQTACKLLDSRIGNYGVYSTGYKIDSSNTTWYVNNCESLSTDQKEAVQMWVSSMIEYLVLNGNTPGNVNNVKLGRFSVNKSNINISKILPSEMNFVDSILVSSGIINRSICIK